MICKICGESYELLNKHGGGPKTRPICSKRSCQNKWTWRAKKEEYRQKKLAAYYKDMKERPDYRRDINRKAKAKQRFGASREEIFARFNHQCANCGKTGNLAIHHLDNRGRKVEGKRKPNNDPKNLMVLCAGCHVNHHVRGLKLKMKV